MKTPFFFGDAQFDRAPDREKEAARRLGARHLSEGECRALDFECLFDLNEDEHKIPRLRNTATPRASNPTILIETTSMDCEEDSMVELLRVTDLVSYFVNNELPGKKYIVLGDRRFARAMEIGQFYFSHLELFSALGNPTINVIVTDGSGRAQLAYNDDMQLLMITKKKEFGPLTLGELSAEFWNERFRTLLPSGLAYKSHLKGMNLIISRVPGLSPVSDPGHLRD